MKPGPATSTLATASLAGMWATMAPAILAGAQWARRAGAHGDGGGPVAVGGVRRAREAKPRHVEGGKLPGLLGGLKGGADEFLELLGHVVSLMGGSSWWMGLLA